MWLYVQILLDMIIIIGLFVYINTKYRQYRCSIESLAEDLSTMDTKITLLEDSITGLREELAKVPVVPAVPVVEQITRLEFKAANISEIKEEKLGVIIEESDNQITV